MKFPWKFVDSPYYKNLIHYPPTNVNFVNVSSRKTTVLTSPPVFKFQLNLKKIIRKTLEIFNVPNISFIANTNKIDLVHCAHCLLTNKIPWVVDVEHYWTFSSSSKISYSKIGKNIIRKFLKKSSCKKILPWSYAAYKTIEEAIKDREITKKMNVVYPAVPLPKNSRKKNDKITLLFIGRYFYLKGGMFVLEVFKRLKLKYDVNCILISLTIPEKLIEKYKKFVKIYKSVSDYYLFKKIYPSTDIFVYPGFSDTFGFTLLEAMSFGIPIVTIDAFARKEIIINNKNGFVINKPKCINIYKINERENKLIEEMVKRCSTLIENSSLREKMGRYGRKLIENGKFSIKERNKKLKEIYEEALHY